MRIAFLEHFDSFSYNVIHLLQSVFGDEVQVFLPTASYEEITEEKYDLLVIGPGPGRPSHYPLIKKCLDYYQEHGNILGVCLGMQAINEYYGGKTQRAPVPVHGKQSSVFHENHPLFKRIPSPFPCMRYHSLMIEPSNSVEVIADCDSVPMAIQVKNKNIIGLQYHPESFASQYGKELMGNLGEIFGIS